MGEGGPAELAIDSGIAVTPRREPEVLALSTGALAARQRRPEGRR